MGSIACYRFFKNTLSANLYRFPYPTRYSYFVALSTQMQWERLHIQASILGAYVDEQVEQYYKGDNQKYSTQLSQHRCNHLRQAIFVFVHSTKSRLECPRSTTCTTPL